MIRQISPLIISGIILLSVSACDVKTLFSGVNRSHSTNTSTVIENRSVEALVLPVALSQNITPRTPTLALSVQNGSEKNSQAVNAKYDEATSAWIADIKVQPGNSTEFIVTWSEQVQDQSLKIAQTTKTVPIPTDIRQINLDIPISEYNESFDVDADGLSNLTEITNSTNPFDSSDPIAPVVKIELNLNLEIPGDFADKITSATILPSAFLNGTELTLSFDSDADERNEPAGDVKPVSDADFENALKKFGALSQAIENKDAEALDRLATSSQHSDLIKRLIKNNYDRIEVSIGDIQLRNIDKSITGTLQIDSLVRSNGDRGSLSEKYSSRTITSRRVNGDWTKIEW